jgi:hypothetical protein
MLFLTVGCATTKKVADTALQPIDSGVHLTKSGWESVGHFFQSNYKGFVNTLDDTHNSFKQSTLAYYLLSDDSILESRQHFSVWDGDETYNASQLLERYLKEKSLSPSFVQGLDGHRKLTYLNNIFFEEALQSYKKAFLKQHPKPKFDKFSTDRENLKKANEYKLALYKSENTWEINLDKIKKHVLNKALDAFYGKPYLSNISYDPYSEKLYFDVKSSKNDFTQKVYLELEKKEAQKFEKTLRDIHPLVYFQLENGQLQVVGITLALNKEKYLAQTTDEGYTRESFVMMDIEDNYSFTELNINPHELNLKEKPPAWYGIPSESEYEYLAYGQGFTEQEAKELALSEIVMHLKVEATVDMKLEQVVQGDELSKKMSMKSQFSSNNVAMEKAEITKREKSSVFWYVQARYKY